MISVKFPIHTVRDLHRVLQAAERFDKITGRTGSVFRKRMAAALDENGQWRLWRDLRYLVEFARALENAPAIVEMATTESQDT